jgi:hypothetical protein
MALGTVDVFHFFLDEKTKQPARPDQAGKIKAANPFALSLRES